MNMHIVEEARKGSPSFKIGRVLENMLARD
jgi:hypothetical protein